MFIIATNNLVAGHTMYLGWQSPVWDDDGYFWTYEDVIKDILETNNTPEHPFAFKTKREAKRFAREMKIRGFHIVEF